MTKKPLKAIILAAGKGTRMRTDGHELPKVMRLAAGVPLIGHVLSAISFVEPRDTVIVVGYMKERVMEAFSEYRFAEQEKQLGTGHAVMAAMAVLGDFKGDLLVCCGDMPLIRRETYESLCETHIGQENACTILSGTTALLLPYGRILRDGGGSFAGVVEEKDCSPEQLAITELNSGVYVFDADALRMALAGIGRDNVQGEYYLTDAPLLIKKRGLRVGVCRRELGNEIIGVNTPRQLLIVEEELGKG